MKTLQRPSQANIGHLPLPLAAALSLVAMIGLRPTTVMWLIAAIALGAIAVWPCVRPHAGPMRLAQRRCRPLAPVAADYSVRDRDDRVLGARGRPNTTAATCSARATSRREYLQRYRERGDIGDVVARASTWRSDRCARSRTATRPPRSTSASALRRAAPLSTTRSRVTRHIETYRPGRSRHARSAKRRSTSSWAATPTQSDRRPPERRTARPDDDATRARYADDALRRADRPPGARPRAVRARRRRTRTRRLRRPARRRARGTISASGELAFEAGDNDARAGRTSGRALRTFPNYSEANRVLARVELRASPVAGVPRRGATRRPQVVPYPEVLGYEADAQRALGDTAGGRADRRSDPHDRADRQRAARSPTGCSRSTTPSTTRTSTTRTASRSASWPCATTSSPTIRWRGRPRMDGHWDEARARIGKARPVRHRKRAARLPRRHRSRCTSGDRDAARRWLDRAVALNPQFDGAYADDARAKLTELR